MSKNSDPTLKLKNLLPGEGSSSIFETIRDRWEFQDGFFPVPKFEISCPDCGKHDFYLAYLGAGRKKNTPNPYRMGAHFVCTSCCHKFNKSLTVPEEIYEEFRDFCGGHPCMDQPAIEDYLRGDDNETERSK